MSAADALPSLPDGDRPPGGPGARLSPDAQLATALLLQARALERSLAGRSRPGPVLDSHEVAALLRRAERARAERAEAAARRERRLLLAAGACLLAAVLGTGGAVWIALDGPADGRVPADAVATAGPDADPAAAAAADDDDGRHRIEAVVTAAVGRALDEGLASQRGVEQALTEAQHRAADAERALHALRAEHGQLADTLAARDAAEQALCSELTSIRDDRLDQIGQNARLTEQVLERDRRIAKLQSALAELREAAAAGLARPAGTIVTRTASDGATSLAALVSEALRRSGAPAVQVAEAAGPRDGALVDLLLILDEHEGESRVVEAARARLASDGRGLQLLCSEAGAPGGAAPGAFSIELPSPDLAAWQALGLPLPAGYLERSAVVAALALVVEPHGWSVGALQGWDGSALVGLELRRDEPGGGERLVRAARASLSPVGPELVLEDGSIAVRGDERPFYGGVHRIALPGSDYGCWLASVTSIVPLDP